MRRAAAALLALACLATGVACTVALYTLPRLIVPVAAQTAQDSTAMPTIRAGLPFSLTEYGTTLYCISNRAAQLDPPILWAPTPTPAPLGAAGATGAGGGYGTAPNSAPPSIP